MVLFDEADASLEQRSRRIIARNKLVSAFLGCQKYCDSLSFLIASHVRGIDEVILNIVHNQTWKRCSTRKEIECLANTVSEGR